MAASPQPFAWNEAMRIGLGLMGLAPAQFWAMTPREFAAAAGLFRRGGGEAPSPGELDALMRAFPDHGKQE